MIDTLIKRKIQELPANTRYAIEHFDWIPRVRKIAEKYHLQLSDVDVLHREILLSILGLISPEEFYTSLSKLPIPEEELPSLLKDIQQEIAIPLQKMEFSEEVLRKVREEKAKKEMEEKLSHEEVKDSLRGEGIVLVDEGEDFPPISDGESRLSQEQDEKDISEEFSQSEEEKIREAEKLLEEEREQPKEGQNLPSREEPEGDDYRGVTLHRVPTVGISTGKKLSIESHKAFSPQKITLSSRKGNSFLRHIGAV